jgi:tRNA U34 5-methylaminomethyl-2-thiouridine-forming methyltransferase MnmC
MNRKIIVTNDNSKSLFVPSLNETYHSTNGALQEARHIFVNNGLAYFDAQKSISVFEMGFGTGLNALVTLQFSKEKKKAINYHCIEKYPLPFNLIEELDHPTSSHLTEFTEDYYRLHHTEWNELIEINPNFHFSKQNVDLVDFKSNINEVDLVFFDAFAPQIQPELWTKESLKKMYDLLRVGGILVTYCAQGEFKRVLKSIGFLVEGLPGPIGKREITRAIKV